MRNKSATTLNQKSIALDLLGWIFGILVLGIGLINTFWGNDPFFGVFLALLSFVYFPPVNVLLNKWTGFSIPGFAKVLLGIFIIWVAIGVGELFAKIEIMLKDLS